MTSNQKETRSPVAGVNSGPSLETPSRNRARDTTTLSCSPVITSRPSWRAATAKVILRPSTAVILASTATGLAVQAGPV